MSTDAPAGDAPLFSGEAVVENADLVFATQDLGRERVNVVQPVGNELGFVPVERPGGDPLDTDPVSPATPGDALPWTTTNQPSPAEPALSPREGFVIRDMDGTAPSDPVDALVIGNSPQAPCDPSDGESGASVAAGTIPFRLHSAGSATQARKHDPPWLVRDDAQGAAAPPSRRGWSARPAQHVDRSAHATLIRLREEAVHLSWKAAWVAVLSADDRLNRKRSL